MKRIVPTFEEFISEEKYVVLLGNEDKAKKFVSDVQKEFGKNRAGFDSETGFYWFEPSKLSWDDSEKLNSLHKKHKESKNGPMLSLMKRKMKEQNTDDKNKIYPGMKWEY